MLPGNDLEMRVLPVDFMELVDDIWGAREMLRDDEPDEDLEEFLEQEVNYLAEIMETPIFSQS